jgi:hypothetical protein
MNTFWKIMYTSLYFYGRAAGWKFKIISKAKSESVSGS